MLGFKAYIFSNSFTQTFIPKAFGTEGFLVPSKNNCAKQKATGKRAIINVWASEKYKAKKKE